MIHRQLINHLLNEHLIVDCQSGFIPGRSTGDAIYGLMMDLYTARNKGQRSAVVFLDMRKAFDTVDHLILLAKLNSAHLDDRFMRWFRSYLHSRKQQTRANNITSTPTSVNRGVPQGSVVGPLLFTLYVNDVCSRLKNSRCFLYADDIALVVSGKDVHRVQLLLQEDLNSVNTWCQENKLTVNAAKTKVLWSYSQRSIPDLEGAVLTLNNEPLEIVPVFNYLGVKINRYLGMTQHMKKVIGMVQSKLPALRRIRAGADQPTAVLVYTTMIRSTMEYCSFTYGGGPVWAERKLQTLQNDALRICEKIRDPCGVNIVNLHGRNNVPMLEDARQRQLLTYLHKYSLKDENVITPTRTLRGNASVKLKAMRSKSYVYDKSPLLRGLNPGINYDRTRRRSPRANNS